MGNRAVHRDRREPGSKTRSPLELAQIHECLQVCLLNEIVGVGVVVNNSQCHVAKESVVATDENLILSAVSSSHGCNDIFIGLRAADPLAACGVPFSHALPPFLLAARRPESEV